jgi:hypothetical protein
MRISYRSLGKGRVAEQILGGAAERLASRPELGQFQSPVAKLDPSEGEARQSDQHGATLLGHAERAARSRNRAPMRARIVSQRFIAYAPSRLESVYRDSIP